MTSMLNIPAKSVSAIFLVPADFSQDIPSGGSISSYTCTAAVYSGTDASPSSILSGSAALASDGVTVTQKIIAGTLGVIYYLLFTATMSDGRKATRAGYLAVVPDAP